MNRFWLIAFFALIATAPLGAGERGDKKAIAFVQKLQLANGAFVNLPVTDAEKKATPSLRATSSAVRALHYLGGEMPNREKCIQFVETCFDKNSGGFSDAPGGKPDVFTTAVGVMAVTELGMPTEKYAASAVKFLSANAKGFDEIRIAAAGLERLKMKSPKNDEWLREVSTMMNRDGTFGSGPGKARETGSRVVTLLRLGGKADSNDLVIKALDAGQRKSGGWGKAEVEGASDLETTYRVMRCYRMLSAQPARGDAVRAFVAKCRNGDGYGVEPGQAPSIGGTYFAAIVLHWLGEKK